MSHALHDHLARLLGDKLRSRRIVVWYDPARAFAPFVAELRGKAEASATPRKVKVGKDPAWLVEDQGSLFELRFAVEPHVSSDRPDAVLLYLGGRTRDLQGSPLLELEKAGHVADLAWPRVARHVLADRYTDGIIDAELARGVDYAGVVELLDRRRSGQPPSALRSVFRDAPDGEAILAAWLAGDGADEAIVKKDAIGELVALVLSRLGLPLDASAPLAKLRAIVLRYVLVGELRSDLQGVAPARLEAVPVAPSEEHLAAVRDVARRLRTVHAAAYPALADGVEAELGLATMGLPPAGLGSIDTFRFEEKALLGHAAALIAEGRHAEALAIVDQREGSFWLDRDMERKGQWEACRRMAALGLVSRRVRDALGAAPSSAAGWVEAYAAEDGWHGLDLAQRRLETWIVKLADDPDERALGVVRRAYDDACRELAEGFCAVLARGGWTVAGALHQTRIHADVVAAQPTPVAYVLVDAMRFEMGVELLSRLPPGAERSLRPAVCALPSITTVGMAALQPAAGASFAVVERGGRLGAVIDEAFLPDLGARQRHAASRIPGLVDLGLDELLGMAGSRLQKRLDGAQVVVVRSQEIDDAGESGFGRQARRVMDAVIDDVARALRKLAAAGVEHAVVTADHGHLFHPTARDDAMKIDAPGGAKVELHRRCWIGRGGATPAGCVRVPATQLGYASDLDVVFPVGAGVFKAGGGLAFHHGGASLQELVIPVVTVCLRGRASSPPKAGPKVRATELPETITNRIFTAKLHAGGAALSLFETAMTVRPVLMAGGKQVGGVGMALGAELDPATGCVTLGAAAASIGFILSDDTRTAVRIVVLDPATDAELYRSAEIPVKLLA